MDNRYLTISELNHYIKGQFDNDGQLQSVLLKGEISNFKNHTTGHLYFTLKDENSRIKAVMFSFSARHLQFLPKDGMKVLVAGKVSVYEPNGDYQVYIDHMDPDGIGNLYYAYEELKKKLNSEGLFDENHKKKIPKFPGRIGIITAPTGAAIHDIISTIKRRYPICETYLFPSLVQGEGAKENIVKQLIRAQDYELDVIILGRGGGSIEDLWAFNEEIVARAVYECKVPIISAVGHEVDYTICDYVADHRAPTPTGAAEIAVPNIIDVRNYLEGLQIRMNKDITNRLTFFTNILKNLENTRSLKSPMDIYEIKSEKLSYIIEKSNHAINNVLINNNNILLRWIDKLELLNPIAILEKGYSVTKKEDKIIKSLDEVKKNDLISIKLFKGLLKARVEGVEKDGKRS